MWRYLFEMDHHTTIIWVRDFSYGTLRFGVFHCAMRSFSNVCCGFTCSKFVVGVFRESKLIGVAIPDVAASIPAESSGNGSTDSGGAADDVPNGASGDVNGASGDANDASSDANGASSDANGEPKTNAGATTAVPRGGSVASGKSSTKKVCQLGD